MFQSINGESIAEIIEKKSRFIASLYEANSKEEAENILQETRKKYHDAKHNCYAYIVKENEKLKNNYNENNIEINNIQEIEKCSDDGEPSGTAGAPLLALLKSSNLTNVIIIVTRYFGGILLGTGGLVRAYTEVAQKAINNAKIVQKDYGIKYVVKINYNNLKEIQYICRKLNINIVDTEYKENINLYLESTVKSREILEKENVKILSIKNIESKLIEISKIW